MYLHVYHLYKKPCLYLQPHQAPIHMCMHESVFACIIYICIYMLICMYICMYVYVCVCIPFASYNNTTFDHICMKPQWLSGRYRLMWLGRQVFKLQLCQRHFIPALFSFCTENLPPCNLQEDWIFGGTLSHLQNMHTSSYMQIHTYTARYIPIHADACTYM